MSAPSERLLLEALCRDTPALRSRLPEQRRRRLESGLADLRADTGSLVDVCRDIGYPTSAGQRDGPLPGQPYAPLPGALPVLPPGVYGCPGARCDRVEPRDADGVVPACAVFGTPLRRTPVT